MDPNITKLIPAEVVGGEIVSGHPLILYCLVGDDVACTCGQCPPQVVNSVPSYMVLCMN